MARREFSEEDAAVERLERLAELVEEVYTRRRRAFGQRWSSTSNRWHVHWMKTASVLIQKGIESEVDDYIEAQFRGKARTPNPTELHGVTAWNNWLAYKSTKADPELGGDWARKAAFELDRYTVRVGIFGKPVRLLLDPTETFSPLFRVCKLFEIGYDFSNDHDLVTKARRAAQIKPIAQAYEEKGLLNKPLRRFLGVETDE